MDWLERAEQQLQEDFDRGHLTQTQYNEEMRELHRSYREAAEEAAQRAYEEEKERW